MKSLLLSAFLCLHSISYSQITFEPVNSPVDFSLSAVRRSPTGEYFVQSWNDINSIYTSMNGEDWTKSQLPVSYYSSIDDIQFFSDGTPVLNSIENLIRRNGIWYTMKLNGGTRNVGTSFIKGDSLFVYQDKTFAYSLDRGKTFTTIFTYGKNIGNAYLWKFEHHFVLYHTGGVKDSLTVFTENGEPVFSEPILLSITKITYNSCGKVLFYDRDHYFLLEDQGLNFSYGVTTDIIPNYADGTEFFSQGGHYYLREGDTIFVTTGCDFAWETLEINDLISSKSYIWISPQEDILLFNLLDDFFIEKSNGTNAWEEHSLTINSPHVSTVIESVQEHQIARTYNGLFSKGISDFNWIELDTIDGYDIQYSPKGDLYIKSSDILYSSDNGISFNTISLPENEYFGHYFDMEVLNNQSIFLRQEYIGDSYYTLNNGQDWIPTNLSSSIKYSQVKLVGNYIILTDLKYSYTVTRINIISNELTSEDLGEFYETGASVIQDDGTIYFNAHDVNAGRSGLHRYKFGEQVEYLGQFQELATVNLLAASGTDLYGFEQKKYYFFDGDKLTTLSYTGLPSIGYIQFILSENEYVYAIVGNSKIFRSSEPLSYKQFITGSVYNHVNQDCTLDTSEATLKYWQVKIEKDDYIRIKTSDNEGKFSFSVPDGDYKLSSQPINSNWDLCESHFDISIDENHSNVKQDFLAKGQTECAELELDVSTPLLRRCFDNYYYIQVRNTGPQASEGTTLTLELDPYCYLISVSIPYIQVNDSILKFDLGELAVNDNISFQIFFTLSCNAPIGIEHCLKGSLSDDKDCGHSRSSYTECQQNIGSYDPNDKRIFNEGGQESETVDKGEYIYYHIRFQNTGTDTAFNIRVVDPFSPKLDLGTLEMLSASHPYNYIITDGPSLAVNFENILLPDSSTNEPASHGYFKFRIKPLPEYDYGTNISNQAGIYFDFNEPVLTNETTLFIQPRVGTKDANEFIKFNVYPNPADNELSLDISEADLYRIDAYEIFDYLGQIVIQSAFINRNINIAHLTPGIYNLNLIENGVIIGGKKFVKL